MPTGVYKPKVKLDKYYEELGEVVAIPIIVQCNAIHTPGGIIRPPY